MRNMAINIPHTGFIIYRVWIKTKSKESIMDKDNAVISTQFGDIVLEFFDDIAQSMSRALSYMLKMDITMVQPSTGLYLDL